VIRLEEKYHLDHAHAWFDRLTVGPLEARQRFAEGLSEALPDAVGLFEPVPGEDQLVADAVLPMSSEAMLAAWLEPLGRALEEASLDYVLERHVGRVGEMVPTSAGEIEAQDEPFRVPGLSRRDGRWVHEGEFVGAGGRTGRHSEDFEPLWDEMTKLHREHPGAAW